jgi:hypothetical protein
MMDLTTEIEFWPADEVRKLMKAFEAAREKRDLDSLVWCAERMLFLYTLSEEGEIEPSAAQVETMFTMAFRDSLPKPPALIAGVMEAPEEPERAAAGRVREAVIAALRKLDRLDELIDVHASARDGAILAEQVEEIRGAVAALATEGKA